jgi:hypothetical protein
MGYLRSDTPVMVEEHDYKFKSINEHRTRVDASMIIPDTPVLGQPIPDTPVIMKPVEQFYRESVKKVEIKSVVPEDLSFRTSSRRLTSSIGSSSSNRNKEFEFDSDQDDEMKEGAAQNLTTVGHRNQFFRYDMNSVNDSKIESSSSSSFGMEIRSKKNDVVSRLK